MVASFKYYMPNNCNNNVIDVIINNNNKYVIRII